jgi:heptosyltransferase-2
MQKILIIQTAFIGDAVLATALAEKWHSHYPTCKIDFLVRKGNENLLANNPKLNEILIWDKKQSKYKNLFQLLKKIRAKRYDVVINVQRFAATGLLTIFSGAKQTVGFNKNPFSFLFTHKVQHIISTPEKPLHEVERNQTLIKKFTDKRAAKPKLYPSPLDYETIKKYQHQSYICIAPASVWFTKQYPSHKWIELINALPHNFIIYLLGAPTDVSLCQEIANACNKPIEVLAGKLSFLQSAALQQNAAMNYVNDSAPMHFASAVNAPVTAIYCSTLPSFGFGPLSSKSTVIETKENLSCKPCGLHGQASCPKKHFNCANTIKVETLLQVLATN